MNQDKVYLGFIRFVNYISEYQDHTALPLDIGDVVFGLRWIRFECTHANYTGIPNRLLTVEGCFEWKNKRYSFRHGIGWLSGKFEIFFNGPHVIKEYKPLKEVA